MAKTMRQLGMVLGLGILAATLLAACSSDDESDGDGTTAPTAASETTVNVTLSEWAVEPDVMSVPSGEVTFSVSNAGTVSHELVIVRSDVAADALPVDGGVVPEDEIDLVGEVEEFPAGETATGSFRLDAGNYILICNLPAHYETGMHSAFTVE